MKEAAFSLLGYKFPSVKMDMSVMQNGKNEYKIDITPDGEFDQNEGKFLLTFKFSAYTVKDGESVSFADIVCEGVFSFKDVHSIEEIPFYFYGNSIAILFPYVRAFISTVTLQANYMPLVIPTMNLSDLSEILRNRTSVKG